MPTQTSDKPKWLRRLERESWQAELIISGAAIIGSLQLPGLLEQVEVYVLLEYPRETLYYFFLMLLYWKILAMGLIALFVSHFVVRALWIGLVGLNSVFPGGFKTNERFSKHFQERMRDDFGDVDGYIQRLDALGSGMFGVGFALAGILLNVGSIGALLCFGYAWLTNLGVSGTVVLLIMVILLAPLLIFSLAGNFLHMKSMREKEWVKRIHYPLTKLVYYLMYPLNRRYTVTALNLLSFYYADRKGYFAYIIAGSVLMGILGGALVMSDPYTGYFIDRLYHRIADDSTRVYPDSYAEGAVDGLLVRPVIAARTLSDPNQLSVWVPLPQREYIILQEQCSVAAVETGGLDRHEVRKATWLRITQCAKQYIELTLNGQPIFDYALKREYRENETAEQYGVRVTIERPNFRPGANLLGVITKYPHEETGLFRQSWVPFNFVPRLD